jgi:hypothetical protein
MNMIACLDILCGVTDLVAVLYNILSRLDIAKRLFVTAKLSVKHNGNIIALVYL